ncbi:uncharacterized protein FA14DRAFT_36025 [Meira miltonrushii]|uniref:Uncharacterized protein n=1 Tax=Meira miltonrushii TaxID=1280837 RepID=A0A316VCX1_9BASI|nr:uncharacterized protein FA14DRAFT_36025 [Meira miltonrushii]PWN34938.1 hypothetical protein FA14DRAFT_36025 [Meira miltonrushii]
MQEISIYFFKALMLCFFLLGSQVDSVPVMNESPEIGRPIPQNKASPIEIIALNSGKKGKPYVIQKRSPIVTMTHAEMEAIREHDRGRRAHFQKIITENAEKWHREHGN